MSTRDFGTTSLAGDLGEDEEEARERASDGGEIKSKRSLLRTLVGRLRTPDFSFIFPPPSGSRWQLPLHILRLVDADPMHPDDGDYYQDR